MVLSDSIWDRIKDFLPGKVGDRGVTAKANRLFVEAVLWIARTGSPWRKTLAIGTGCACATADGAKKARGHGCRRQCRMPPTWNT